MEFDFTANGLKGSQKAMQRAFEMLPGLTSWGILLGMVALCAARPLEAAAFVIAFDFYWLLRIFYSTVFLLMAYFRLSTERNTDWASRIADVDASARGLSLPRRRAHGLSALVAERSHAIKLSELRRSNQTPPISSEIWHLVVIPVAKEGADVVEPGLKSLASQRYPLDQVIVRIALEERAPETTRDEIEALAEKYRPLFGDIRVSLHPDGVPGEAKVKGANATHAAREAAAYFEARGIGFERVVASCFDSDTVLSSDYLGCLTYHFLVNPCRNRASFQPIPVYQNNLWDAPGFARILEMGSSFFLLIEATNPEKLVTFSSHSMSFKALVDVGYWPVDMISDDSAIYWKAYLKFDGDYRVVPMYVTVSMDAVAADGWWRTVRNVYKQKRRWSWGVENFPIVMRGFLKSPKIRLFDKLRLGFKLFEGHVAWATWAFILSVVGWLPALFAGNEFSHSVLFYNAPRITGTIFHLAGLSLIASMGLSLLLLPDKPMKHPFLKRVLFALEWLFIPAVATFLSALPALHTQTRLMAGRPMEFWVTEKRRRAAASAVAATFGALFFLAAAGTPAYAADRGPAVAGSFYPADEASLKREVWQLLRANDGRQRPSGRAAALIVPHAGYSFSGKTAGAAYRLLGKDAYDTVVVIGPAHRGPSDGTFVWAEGKWMSPLGDFETDTELARAIIAAHASFSPSTAPHQGEHAVETQLPFLRYSAGSPRLVAIATNDGTPAARAALVNALVEASKSKRLLVVASTDMTHYKPARAAEAADRGTLELFSKLDSAGTIERLSSGQGQLCGAAAALAAIDYAKALGADPTVLAYATSADAGAPGDRAVGYGAVGFFVPKEPLSEDARRQLLALARKAIAQRLESGGIAISPAPAGELSRPAAVFVTLWEGENLRGCIGGLAPGEPLAQAVQRAAVGAAFADPRFSELGPYDLERVRIEISVLDDLVPAAPEDVDPDTDGVLIERGAKAGVFLPGVARRAGWDRRRLLNELCTQKAGLSEGCWETAGTALYTFSTQDFAETQPGVS